MKLNKKEKEEIAEEVGELLEDYEDTIICCTERRIISAGTEIELLANICKIVDSFSKRSKLPKQVIKESITNWVDGEDEEENNDEEEIRKLFENLMKGEE
ncbi:MAG: hypothetical protein PUE33_04700 [bacterium]|nr:hypothetical protein [bacterium]